MSKDRNNLVFASCEKTSFGSGENIVPPLTCRLDFITGFYFL